MVIGKIIKICLVVILVLGLPMVGFSEENKKIRTAKETKEVEGTVSMIDKNYIAIVYAADPETRTEYEMLLPIDKKLKLVHVRSLDQIKVGDRVKLQFEESTDEYSGGEKKKARKANTLSFIRSAPPKQETETLESEGSSQ